MKASNFECRHQTLLHLLLVGAAVLTYVACPDDIVWALVRRHPDNRLLEHLVFSVAAIMIIASAGLETWAIAHPATHNGSKHLVGHPILVARLLLASAVGLLLPLVGSILLVLGEAFLVLRMVLRAAEPAAPDRAPSWGSGFRTAAFKWGLAASMIVFALTLQDRIAEIGAGISFLVWVVLNNRRPIRSYI